MKIGQIWASATKVKATGDKATGSVQQEVENLFQTEVKATGDETTGNSQQEVKNQF